MVDFFFAKKYIYVTNVFYFVLISNIEDNARFTRVFPAIAASMRETREMISAVIARSWDAPDALIFLKE